MVFLLCLSLIGAEPLSPEERCEQVQASYIQWLDSIDFRVDCQWRLTSFASSAEAKEFHWDWDALPLDKIKTTDGWIARMGDRVRISYNPRTPPTVVDQASLLSSQIPAGSGIVAMIDVGFDQVTNGRFGLNRVSENSRKRVNDYLLVHRADAETPSASTKGGTGVVTPLRPLKALSSDPFNLYGPYEANSPPLAKTITVNREGNDELTVEYVTTKVVRTRVLEFEPAGEQRLLSVTTSELNKDESDPAAAPKLVYDSKVTLEGYVTLKRGSVPTLIRLTSHDMAGTTSFEEYLSTVPVEAQMEDFRFAFNKDAPILGVKNKDKFMKDGYIDVDQLTEDDVPEVPHAGPAPNPEIFKGLDAHGTMPSNSGGWQWYGVVGLNVLVICVLAVVVMRKRTQRA